MFDLGEKLGDMSKIASQAKKMQKEQEKIQNEQIKLLKKISAQMDSVEALLRAQAK